MADVPVAVFGFNRPDKLEGLFKRLIAEDAGLIYAFCDGPRHAADEHLCQATQDVARRYSARLKVELVVRPSNTGLNANIVSGVTAVLAEHDSLMVFEDDVYPLKGCLAYLEKALQVYRHRVDILSVGTYHGLPSIPEHVGQSLLSPRFNCWGWATWADRWREWGPLLQSEMLPFRHYYQVPTNAGSDIPMFVRRARLKGAKPTWDTLSALYYLKNSWLQVQPRVNLVRNMGFDGSGTHCEADPQRDCSGFDFDTVAHGDVTQLDSSIQRDPQLEFLLSRPYSRWEWKGLKAFYYRAFYHSRLSWNQMCGKTTAKQ